MKLLELVGLAEDAHQRVSSYSKGMKMRLNFVRALLPDPEIVFLDEPTVGMDPVNARRIKDQIQEHEIETIHSQEATLEDIFIETTGRQLQ